MLSSPSRSRPTAASWVTADARHCRMRRAGGGSGGRPRRRSPTGARARLRAATPDKCRPWSRKAACPSPPRHEAAHQEPTRRCVRGPGTWIHASVGSGERLTPGACRLRAQGPTSGMRTHSPSSLGPVAAHPPWPVAAHPLPEFLVARGCAPAVARGCAPSEAPHRASASSSRSMKGACASLMALRAAAGAIHATRSTSGSSR